MLKHGHPSAVRGAAMVELAIVMPLLLLLTVGLIELGALFFTWNALNKTVRDSARFLAFEDVSERQADDSIVLTAANQQRAIDLVRYGKFCASPCSGPFVVNFTGATNPTFNVPNPTYEDYLAADGIMDHVVVTATYSHPLITGGLFNALMGFFGGNFNAGAATFPLQATMVARVL